jgi:hypothetical protein
MGVRVGTARPRPDQRPVRAAVVRRHFDPPAHVPADFTTAGGQVHHLETGLPENHSRSPPVSG